MIDETNFPDANFRNYLLKGNANNGDTTGPDKDGDGVLTPEEIAAVTEMDVQLMGIADLTGIQYFTELKTLNCNHNNLTTLDVSRNKKLETLRCSFNQLTKLDVSDNAALTTLEFMENQLTSLDLSKTGVKDVGNFTGPMNKYKVVVDQQGRVDLKNLPDGFDISKVSNLQGGTVDGTVLTIENTSINDGFFNVTYTYDCGNGLTENFILMVKSIHKHEYCSWKYDETDHWHVCKYADCPYKEGSITDKDIHDFDEEGTCTVCGYQIGTEDPANGSGSDDLILAGIIVGSAAAWSIYETGTGIYRVMNMKGIPLPTTRAELAMLVWEKAGKPEPERTTYYTDVDAADTDLQKATLWVVEHDLMDEKEDYTFKPNAHVTKLRVCITWDRAKQRDLL